MRTTYGFLLLPLVVVLVVLLELLLLLPQPARSAVARTKTLSLFMCWSMPTVRFLAALLAALPLPVGHSVQGRVIRPIVLGHAPAPLLVVGCIHGNEPAGLPVVRALQRAGALPGTEIVVVPALNPDGY